MSNSLMMSRRFAPLFWCQFFSAFSDNFLKNALVFLILFKIGGSASLTTMGLADVRGVKVKYLFNLFDYWGTIVTSRENVKTLKDLEGKELAGARSTTKVRRNPSTR